jgi:hypothetical protein
MDVTAACARINASSRIAEMQRFDRIRSEDKDGPARTSISAGEAVKVLASLA